MIKRQALEICKLISKHRELNALVGYTRCIIAAPHAWYHSGSESQDEGPESFGDPTPDQQERYNTQQRSATELVWPATKQQEKFAARIYRSIAQTFLEEHALRELLVNDLGFSIKDVRMSPDNSKAFVLWSSYTGHAAMAGRELHRALPQLKAAVAKRLGARHMPRLEFRLDKLSNEEQDIEDIFKQLDDERKDNTK